MHEVRGGHIHAVGLYDTGHCPRFCGDRNKQNDPQEKNKKISSHGVNIFKHKTLNKIQ